MSAPPPVQPQPSLSAGMLPPLGGIASIFHGAGGGGRWAPNALAPLVQQQDTNSSVSVSGSASVSASATPQAAPPFAIATSSDADDLALSRRPPHMGHQPPLPPSSALPRPLPLPFPSAVLLPQSSMQQDPQYLDAAAAAVTMQSTQSDMASPPSRPPPAPLDTMRAYRACLNCRNRKSKCDLDLNQGRPPCRRCQREGRECILGESHRGGRRVRKKPKIDESGESSPPSQQGFPASGASASQYSPFQEIQNPHENASQPFQARYERQQAQGGQGYTWQQPTPTATSASDATGTSRQSEQDTLTNQPLHDSYDHRKSSTISTSLKPGENGVAHETIASADLQNPSDALEILAQVADRAEDGDSTGSEQIQGPAREKIKHLSPGARRQRPSSPRIDDQLYYKPVQDRLLSPEMVYHLFSTYEKFFHPFFPIAPRESFDRARIPWMSLNEPHLFSAILTVASKDNEQIHQICYDHMQQLISMILAGADVDIEAVEALLLLSQWVSHRPQAEVAVGRGEEDRVAWMCIGTALRTGYFLGIDRSSFKPDSREDPVIFRRKRLVWIACYICDRQVSVRVGKGFWARGPGPLSGLKANDFPTLASQSKDGDDFGLILQANLELTQIFSNVHDILYSSKGHGWKEMLEGRYAKYLDDFRTSIRNWNDVWGTMTCSPQMKASLLLTYDYLRLYVNAFAYQATISRALTFQRDSQNSRSRSSVPLINATATDARFIYEALDAAKSLLSTFNNFVEPETLRYMPSSFYLYIVYSAVFLYKARSTTTMTDEERTGVRRMINQTIERLQKSSVGANHMGSRYARLLQLLWRKAPKPKPAPAANPLNQTQQRPLSISERLAAHQNQSPAPNSNSPISSYIPQHQQQQPLQQQPANPQFDPNNQYHAMGMGMGMGVNPNPAAGQSGATGTFSWLDLSAAWNFATQNNSTSGGSTGEMEDPMMDTGVSPFDMGLMSDYSLLEGDNPNLIF